MPLKVPMIKALCFDVDGTLSDTDDLYARQISKFFPKPLFKDPEHTARRFVMWLEAPGNAMMGLADTLHIDDEMIAIARQLSPGQPAKLDLPAWVVGRTWCRPGVPTCPECPLLAVCPRLVDRALGIQGA